ncbi:hypothetical protein BJV74DRAFT_859143 [Russula compacta]|nr:hypothetical protein BJV74DRAFT_859143 [Russula compacta]
MFLRPIPCRQPMALKGLTKRISHDIPRPSAVAVYCGARLGIEPAFQNAAVSLGHALAKQGRPLVYGGGSRGIMGVVSGAALQHGGSVTAVIPSAMVRAGGEGDELERPSRWYIELEEKGRENLIVNSMHERKLAGFIGLPGGFGTFEEIMEVTTWTQLGIHTKPVVLVNVRGFFDPLRTLIKNSVASGFIQASNEDLIMFIDSPPASDPMTFDWGTAALSALDGWSPPGPGYYAWNIFPRDGDRMDMC